MQKTLILWDIDGTLLHAAGAGMKALKIALSEVFGVSGTFEGISFAGRTDPLIVRDIFSRYEIEFNPATLSRYLDGYIAVLPRVLAEGNARVLPGVESILKRAGAHTHVVQGLLTGNIKRGAQAKLGFHGLWEHFPVGAFADDSEIRNELGPHALRRARDHWGVDFPPERVWIVGDTPHDIACGRAFGAKVVAVATGSSKAGDLAAHGPDAVLESLEDNDAFWRAIGA
jgi:phosphoglycolate phosphatase-like HAD superfamily hydrolase